MKPIEWADLVSGGIITIEPHNLDDLGIAIKPGQRCKIVPPERNGGRALIMDRTMAQSVIDFLDEQANGQS